MIDYNATNPMNAFMNTAGGLQQLQQNNMNMQQQYDKAEQQQQAVSQAQQLLQNGTPAEIAQFGIANPELMTRITDAVGFQDNTQKQGRLKYAREVASGLIDPMQATQQRIAELESQGMDATHLKARLSMNPAEVKQLAEKDISVMDPKGYVEFLTAQGGGITPQQQATNDLNERKFGFDKQKFYTKRSDDLKKQASGGLGATSSMKDFRYYQDLKKTDPEAAQQYGRQKGYISKAGEELPVFQQKNLDTAQTAAMESESKANSLGDLASQFTNNADELGGGMFGSWKDGLKTATGSEDAVSSLRKAWISTKNKETMQSLPPGSASDADIKMAKGGFLGNDANPEQVASFLRGLEKIERYKSKYNNFKAQYISEKGDTRGLLKAWKEQSKSNLTDDQLLEKYL